MAGTSNEHCERGPARPFGGAIVFVLPLLMTMEMWWWLGFSIERHKLFMFVALNLAVLIGLPCFAGCTSGASRFSIAWRRGRSDTANHDRSSRRLNHGRRSGPVPQ